MSGSSGRARRRSRWLRLRPARGRGPAGDAGRRRHRGHRGGRLEGEDVGADPAQDQGATRTSCSASARRGWAHRKDSPLLAAELDEFYKHRREEAGRDSLLARQYNKQVKRPATGPHRATTGSDSRIRSALFEKYGQQYEFDPLMLAAQGFQESKLDQEARGARWARSA